MDLITMAPITGWEGILTITVITIHITINLMAPGLDTTTTDKGEELATIIDPTTAPKIVVLVVPECVVRVVCWKHA
jgi:hypothetical protein